MLEIETAHAQITSQEEQNRLLGEQLGTARQQLVQLNAASTAQQVEASQRLEDL